MPATCKHSDYDSDDSDSSGQQQQKRSNSNRRHFGSKVKRRQATRQSVTDESITGTQMAETVEAVDYISLLFRAPGHRGRPVRGARTTSGS